MMPFDDFWLGFDEPAPRYEEEDEDSTPEDEEDEYDDSYDYYSE